MVVLLTSGARAQSIAGFPESRFSVLTDRLPRDGAEAIELRFLLARELAHQAPRVMAATRRTLAILQDWFGPLPATSLTVAGVPWRAPLEAQAMGTVNVPIRWLAPVRDQSLERSVIGAIVRQYWHARASASPAFTESLVIYTGTRAVHHLLEGSNFAAPRFFGGVVPFPLRSLLLSPPVNDPRPRVVGFEELESPGAPGYLPGVRALQSLERYVGWPTMLDALSRLRSRDDSRWDAAALGQILSDVRGSDLRFLSSECFRSDAVFDYALADLRTRVLPTGQVETTVTIARRGTGRFALERDGVDHETTLPVAVRFADGHEVREAIDGGAPSTTLVFTAPVPGVHAAVDPDVMLVLDVDRENNARTSESRLSKLGVRLALHWLAWLQNTMLSYSALW